MIIFRLLEILFALLVVNFVISQIVLPIIRDTKLFPLFRETSKLEDKIVELNTELSNTKLEEVIVNKEVEVRVAKKGVRKLKPKQDEEK